MKKESKKEEVKNVEEEKVEIEKVEVKKDDTKLYLILGIVLLVIFGIFAFWKTKNKIVSMYNTSIFIGGRQNLKSKRIFILITDKYIFGRIFCVSTGTFPFDTKRPGARGIRIFKAFIGLSGLIQ